MLTVLVDFGFTRTSSNILCNLSELRESIIIMDHMRFYYRSPRLHLTYEARSSLLPHGGAALTETYSLQSDNPIRHKTGVSRGLSSDGLNL